MVFARTHPNQLRLIKKFWTCEIDLPVATAKSVNENLTDLHTKLKEIDEYAEDNSQKYRKNMWHWHKKMDIGRWKLESRSLCFI